MIRAEVSQEVWPLARPFEVAREVQTEVPMIHVWLRDEAGHAGQAEAVGIDYDGETPAGMAAEIAALGPQITGHSLVNWALRHIGKRNANLNRAAIATAKEIREMDSRAARWIAVDAIKELESESVQSRLSK